MNITESETIEEQAVVEQISCRKSKSCKQIFKKSIHRRGIFLDMQQPIPATGAWHVSGQVKGLTSTTFSGFNIIQQCVGQLDKRPATIRFDGDSYEETGS